MSLALQNGLSLLSTYYHFSRKVFPEVSLGTPAYTKWHNSQMLHTLHSPLKDAFNLKVQESTVLPYTVGSWYPL